MLARAKSYGPRDANLKRYGCQIFLFARLDTSLQTYCNSPRDECRPAYSVSVIFELGHIYNLKSS